MLSGIEITTAFKQVLSFFILLVEANSKHISSLKNDRTFKTGEVAFGGSCILNSISIDPLCGSLNSHRAVIL